MLRCEHCGIDDEELLTSRFCGLICQRCIEYLQEDTEGEYLDDDDDRL